MTVFEDTISESVYTNDMPRRLVTGETPKAEVLAPASVVLSAGTSLTLRLPGGLKANDLVFVYGYAQGSGGVTPPSGWTIRNEGSGTIGTVNDSYFTYQKDTVTPGTDDMALVTFTNGASGMGGFVAVVEGIYGNPVDTESFFFPTSWRSGDDSAYASQTTVPSTRNGASPYVSGTRDGQVALAFGTFLNFSPNDGMDIGYPTPAGSLVQYTPAATVDGEGYVAGAYQQLDNTDAMDTAGWTVAGSAQFTYGSVSYFLIDIIASFVEDEISDTVYVTGAQLLANQDQEETVSETIAFTPVLLKSLLLVPDEVVSDGMGVSVSVAKYNTRHASTGSDTISAADALVVMPGAIVPETIGLAEAFDLDAIYGLTISDIIRQQDTLRVSIPELLSMTIGIEPVTTVVQGLTVLEELGLAVTLTPNAIYGKAASDVLRLSDALGRFVGGDVSETVGILEAMSPSWAFVKTLSDGIGVEPLTSPQMLLRVTATDGIGIEPEQLLSSIYAGTLADGIEIVAGYVTPDGSFTTWAINTNKGFVTEYDNFVFNSFAPMGQKYIGANSTGLYELNGDDDAGTDIIARIKSGRLQIGGAQLTSFKGAYLGVRGDGDFVLKLTTGDGKTYNYSVTVENLKTSKINIGKGVRTRYFAFELISTGQDFDLESIEFLPIVASRRV